MSSRSEARDTLVRLRETADRVLESLPELVARDPAARNARRRAGRLAAELRTRAGRPICVALVGEPSVGKTELVNALLGRPGLLKASPAGHVTAIRVRPADPGGDPPPPAVSVSYLPRRELARAARFMLGRLIDFVRQEELRYDVTGLRDDNPVYSGFRAFEDVARSWWAAAGDRHSELRTQAWELLRLRDALAVGGDLLDDDAVGPPIVTEPQALAAAIRIGHARQVPPAFPERPGGPPLPRGARLTAEVLARTFPLIARITYLVDTPPGLWDLGGLRDSNGLVFLDLPGLGTAGSRAEYLCAAELAAVTSVVEVLDATAPAAAAAGAFAAVLEARRRSARYLHEPVLVAANIFDKVGPAPEVGPEISLERLRAQSQALDSLYRSLGELSKDGHERIALTSAVPGTRDRRWAAVATALENGGDTGAAAALRAYPGDGGIARLRGLIAGQVQAALRTEIDELITLRAELGQALGLLRALTRPVPDGPQAQTAQERLADLVDGLSSAAAALRAGAAAFRDPQELMVAGDDGSRVGLLTRIGQEAVLAAYRWPVWDPLLEEVRDGRIPVSQAAGGACLADVARDVRNPFDQARAELRGTARRLADEAVADWVRQHGERVAGVRDQMRDPGVQRLLAARLAVLDAHDHGDMRLQQLGRIVDLDWVPGQFARALQQVEERTAAPGAVAFGPGHEHDGQDADPGLATRRRQRAVHRLRHDLAEGLAFGVQSAVATAFGALAVQLEAEFRTLLGRIPVRAELLAPTGAGPAAGPADDRAAGVLGDLILGLPGVTAAGEAT